ncbi:MAG: K+-sensing histidine kinase KdpD, partial [Gammaproteobacteria bacterium]
GTGTGLGLSLSFGIMQRHGGRIEVASALGEGMTFTLRLALRRADRTDKQPEAESAESAPHTKSIARISEAAA